MNTPAPSHRGHVLLADDERVVRDSLSRLLRRRGFLCTAVASGAEALEQLKAGEFDAVLADIHMPGIDGLALVDEIAQVAAGMPIVLLTGRPTVETAARSVRLPVAAYLTKPPDVEELCKIFEEVIAEFRELRAIRLGRSRLQAWEQELAEIEQLRRAPDALPAGALGSFVRTNLRQIILILSDLERATAALETSGDGEGAMRRTEHEAALRRTVEVLRSTKQSFKSKELADLRHQLEQLLERGASAPPKSPAGD